MNSIKENQIRQHTCKSWDDFISKVRNEQPTIKRGSYHIPSKSVIYRGHANKDWTLCSILDRVLMKEANTTEQKKVTHPRLNGRTELFHTYCDRILTNFRYASHGMQNTYPNMPEDELWALGRHYGLLTPLLDWSESPYVAAFFALLEENKQWQVGSSNTKRSSSEYIRIWGLRSWENSWKDLEKKDEFEFVLITPLGMTRQRAQRGLFTKLLSDGYVDIENYLKSRELAHCLETYDIPVKYSSEAITDLNLMNLTHATLFPDIQGAAAQANMDNRLLEQEIFHRNVLEPEVRKQIKKLKKGLLKKQNTNNESVGIQKKK